MKCLSLWQPWATLVAVGAKRIETRCWSTKYRGPLAIHAAAKWSKNLFDVASAEPFKTHLDRSGHLLTMNDHALGLPLGCIVATCTLIDLVPVKAALNYLLDEALIGNQTNEYEFGDYSDGRYAWFLGDVAKLAEPIPFKAYQRLFNVPDHLFTVGGVV